MHPRCTELSRCQRISDISHRATRLESHNFQPPIQHIRRRLAQEISRRSHQALAAREIGQLVISHSGQPDASSHAVGSPQFCSGSDDAAKRVQRRFSKERRFFIALFPTSPVIRSACAPRQSKRHSSVSASQHWSVALWSRMRSQATSPCELFPRLLGQPKRRDDPTRPYANWLPCRMPSTFWARNARAVQSQRS